VKILKGGRKIKEEGHPHIQTTQQKKTHCGRNGEDPVRGLKGCANTHLCKQLSGGWHPFIISKGWGSR